MRVTEDGGRGSGLELRRIDLVTVTIIQWRKERRNRGEYVEVSGNKQFKKSPRRAGWNAGEGEGGSRNCSLILKRQLFKGEVGQRMDRGQDFLSFPLGHLVNPDPSGAEGIG